MVMQIPFDSFPAGQQDWILWATSHKDGNQIDHVGRSLRTQNPRFDLLNKLPPRDHVAAIRKAIERRSLPRDLALRANLTSLFQYRTWDLVPDVMIYTRRPGHPPGFPNGRFLSDDVAKLLADHGDTLLYELSYVARGEPAGNVEPNRPHDLWPRQATNDKPFDDQFPYLAAPWPERPQAPSPMLTPASRWKLALLLAGVLLLAFLVPGLLGAWVAARVRRRRRYL
jgi:hypothetical protein